MSLKSSISFQDVKVEARRKIATRQWPPGDLIPNEEDLALEFGCSRVTVNRALRELAESGLLDRRRKAGTRVVVNPIRKATLSIPITRHEIESRGHKYRYALLLRAVTAPPKPLARAWKLRDDINLLHLTSLHFADGQPFAFEDRWINTSVVKTALNADFTATNANEWLVQNAPFSHGDITFSSACADQAQSGHLKVTCGTALFVIERVTWDQKKPITSVRLHYAPGYQIRTTL